MKKTLTAILTAFCLMVASLPAWAAEPEPVYDNVVTVQGTAVEDLQAAMDGLPTPAGNVRIVLGNRLFSAVRSGVNLSVPTDKGITSLTLAHEGADMVYISIYKTTSSIGDPDFLRFFANGIPLIIDKGVTFGTPHVITGPGMTNMDYYQGEVQLFGGGNGVDIPGDTSITINDGGGVNGAVYGGGFNAKVGGSTFITAHGGYGNIYGGGRAAPEADSGDICADVAGQAVITADNTVTPEYKMYVTHTWYNGDIYGGSVSLTSDFAEERSFSAQVQGGVSIDVNCPVSSAKISGGGYIFSRGAGDAVTLNADVRGNVDIRIGPQTQQAPDFSEERYPFSVLGGGYIYRPNSTYADHASAQVYGNVTITAVESAAAADGQGGCNSILGGGTTENGGTDCDVTVNGSVAIETSRKTLPFKAVGGTYNNVGVAGGGYAYGGRADITGDVFIHICKAPGQSDDYQNVKNIVGGGVASSSGTADIGGNVDILIDEDIRFAGGYVPEKENVSDYKLGIAGGGWVQSQSGTANVAGTVTIAIGKGAVFSTETEKAFRIIGGGKLNSGCYSSAGTGDVAVTLNGTANELDELFCGSFEGRSPSAPVSVTLRDTSVGYLYDRDGWCPEPVTLNFLGAGRVKQICLEGHGNGGEDSVKEYRLNIGNGAEPTELILEDFLYYRYALPWERVDVHIFDGAALKKDGTGNMFYYYIQDLTIDEGGVFAISGDEGINGSLTGGGTLELMALDKRLRVLNENAVFTGTVKVKVTEPHEGQVVATTVQSGAQGIFVYDGQEFFIEKSPDGYGNYDWFLARRGIPVLTDPTAVEGLVYTGSPQAPVSGGGAEGGTLLYSLDGEVYSETVPTAADAGEYIVWYKLQGDDAHGDLGPYKLTVSMAKAPQSPPAAPELESRTGSSVTLKAMAPNVNGAKAEYSMDGGENWQESPIFTGLKAGASYSFAARYAEMENYQASPAGGVLQVSISGGISYRYHIITAAAGEGGSIAPSGEVEVLEEADETFTIVPDEGFTAADVLVDGKSVGPVNTYTFEKISCSHTIEAVFQKAGVDYKHCAHDDACPIHAFTDTNVKAWYHDGVHYCLQTGLMEGYGNGKFGPNLTLTRGMLAQILYNKEGRPAAAGASPFEDVNAGAWYADAIAWASEHDIVAGYGDGRYGPEDPITREQLAAILWRYAGSLESAGSLSGFTDAGKTDSYAVPAFEWAVEQKIVSGKGNGILDPIGRATRAEVATMLQRYVLAMTE